MTDKYPKHVIVAADAIVARAALVPADTARANLAVYTLTAHAHAHAHVYAHTRVCLVCGSGVPNRDALACRDCQRALGEAFWWEVAGHLCPAHPLRVRRPIFVVACHLHGVGEGNPDARG